MQTEQHIDLNRYLGKWYEIARIDSWFEADCINVTATYSLSNYDKIQVVNTCFNTRKNTYKEARGRAWVVDKTTNAKLKVSFLPKYLQFLDKLFNGNYWILKIDPDYKIVLIGEPSHKYLWILSRTPIIDDNLYAEYLKFAQAQGYNVDKLHKTMQKSN